MVRLTDFVAAHWLAAALLLAAAALALRAYLRPGRTAPAAFAFALGVFALGGLLLTKLTVTWFGPEWSVAWVVLFAGAAEFVAAAFVLILSNRWSFAARSAATAEAAPLSAEQRRRSACFAISARWRSRSTASMTTAAF